MATLHLPNIAANTPLWLALVTTFVGAVSGAVIGRTPSKVSYDFVGITVFALALGLGGGITRDLLLGNTPPLAFRTPWYLLTVLGAVVIVLIVGRWIPVTSWVFTFLDALTLALYAVIAAQLAVEFGLPEVGAIAVGFLASITGGVVVALLRGQTPEILIPGRPYALLALIGTIIYVTLDNADGGWAAILCIVTVIVLRFVTLNWNITTKGVRSLPAQKAVSEDQA